MLFRGLFQLFLLRFERLRLLCFRRGRRLFTLRIFRFRFFFLRDLFRDLLRSNYLLCGGRILCRLLFRLRFFLRGRQFAAFLGDFRRLLCGSLFRQFTDAATEVP